MVRKYSQSFKEHLAWLLKFQGLFLNLKIELNRMIIVCPSQCMPNFSEIPNDLETRAQ